jgi:hypothetical protein
MDPMFPALQPQVALLVCPKYLTPSRFGKNKLSRRRRSCDAFYRTRDALCHSWAFLQTLRHVSYQPFIVFFLYLKCFVRASLSYKTLSLLTLISITLYHFLYSHRPHSSPTTTLSLCNRIQTRHLPLHLTYIEYHVPRSLQSLNISRIIQEFITTDPCHFFSSSLTTPNA